MIKMSNGFCYLTCRINLCNRQSQLIINRVILVLRSNPMRLYEYISKDMTNLENPKNSMPSFE